MYTCTYSVKWPLGLGRFFFSPPPPPKKKEAYLYVYYKCFQRLLSTQFIHSMSFWTFYCAFYKNILHFLNLDTALKNKINNWTKWWIFSWYPRVWFMSSYKGLACQVKKKHIRHGCISVYSVKWPLELGRVLLPPPPPPEFFLKYPWACLYMYVYYKTCILKNNGLWYIDCA